MGFLKLPSVGKGKPRASAAADPVPAVETDKHAAVREADPYSFQVAHRRLAWMLRISAGTNVALLFAVVVLVNAISGMLPLKTTEIAFIRGNEIGDRIFRIEPISKNVPGFDLMMEGMARRYVRELLEIDSVTQGERLRFAFRMTDAAFYERFKRERQEQVEKDIKSGLTRSITVESVDRIETVGNTYKFAVDFVQTDKRKGILVEERKLRAYLNMTTRPQRVGPSEKYENPHGITVLDLALKERANS